MQFEALVSWLSEDRLMPPEWAATVVIACLVFGALQLVLMRTRRAGLDRRLVWAGQALLVPLFIVGIKALALRGLGIEPATPLGMQITLLAEILLWLAGAWIVVGGLDAFVWRGLVRRRAGVEIPGLIVHLVAGAIYLFAIYGIISFVFERPVTGLVVSSGVIAAVLGLAMQSTLADLFAGLAISIERPYRIGDWIETEGGVVGRVVDVTWRSTRLLSRRNTILVLPNSKVMGAVVENFTLPDQRFGHAIYVSLPPEVPPTLARRLLLDAALSSGKVLTEPPPVVRFCDIGKRPYQYLLFVHFEDYGTLYLCQDDLLMQIWSFFARAGITPAAVTRDMVVFHGEWVEAAEPSPGELLASVELFKSLTELERAQLVGGLTVRACRAGELIVEEGEAGDSLFIVSSGVVRITRSVGAQEVVELARLGLGSCFGEMSLLTGEPRSARVSALTECQVTEVQRAGLDSILQERPEIIEQLADIMAERRLKNELMMTAHQRIASSDLLRAYVGEIRARIASFFRIAPLMPVPSVGGVRASLQEAAPPDYRKT